MDRRSEEVIACSEELFADSLVAPDSDDVLMAPDSENGSAVATNDDGESLLFVDLAKAISKRHDGNEDCAAPCAKKPRPSAVTEQAPTMACVDLDSAKKLPLDTVAVADTIDPDSVELAPDSVEEVPDSVEEVPDSVEVVRCPRCGTFHAGGLFGEECKQARREASRCARCGLVHSDYDGVAVHIYDMEKFDCEFFIPDVDKLVMRDNSIYLTDEVMKKLEEHYKAVEKSKEEAKMKKQEEEATVHDGKHAH